MTQTPITPELIRAALAFIPAHLPREEWARVGMAIKSEYPDETGFDLFNTWSATAEGYDSKDTRSTWRSIKAAGGVGIGTLLHLAKGHGFKLPKPDQAPAQPTAETLAQQAQERAQRQQQERAQTEAAHAQAAAQAQALWAAGAVVQAGQGVGPYLSRKGVGAHGVRLLTDGTLLVPVCDEQGRLWNVQRIAPAAPADGGPDKLFIKGARKSGLWHWCGAPAGAAALLVAEGYATAASLHEATGLPVAVAFDAGNLLHVAKALRQQYPGAVLVVCGDDDQATEARTGTNPGRQKAQAAAHAVGGVVVLPAGLPAGGSDFNDLHLAQGAGAVAQQVQAAIEAHQQAQAARQPSTPGADKPRPRRAAGAAVGAAGAGPGHSGAEVQDPFTVQDDGVWHQGIDQEGRRKPPEWVCSRLDVVARTRDQDGAGWGYLLEFADPLGKVRQWAMPARMLSGDGGEYRAALLNMGLRIAPSTRARNLLTQYIQTRQPPEFASCTDRIGWHGRAFVLPHETLGEDGERIVFQSDTQMENTFRVKGDAQAWQSRIAALCVGNSRLVFAVSCAFAGPMLRPAGMESGGFHIRGDSSSGKTTALRLAASVYGGPSYLQRWRTTDNALEATAAQHCDSVLILDELAQVEGKVAGECAYMLANEQSKARATRNGAPRARLSWRLLFLSAGELGLADHMAEGMKRTRTGQEVRMADIPADAGAGLGAFEELHGHEGGAALASHLGREAGQCFGAVGRAWMQWACAHAADLPGALKRRVQAFTNQCVPEGASGQVERVAARFALVAAAGEMATEAGLTGWPKGEAERGVRKCFDAWLAARGGAGNGEVQAMLRQVRRFLESHGEGRFTWWHRSGDDHAAKTLQRAGFRRRVDREGKPVRNDSDYPREYGPRMNTADAEENTVEFFVLPETFKSEVCSGFDREAVCRVLLEHGCLVPDKGRAYDCKPRLPVLGLTRCYRINATIFALDV